MIHVSCCLDHYVTVTHRLLLLCAGAGEDASGEQGTHGARLTGEATGATQPTGQTAIERHKPAALQHVLLSDVIHHTGWWKLFVT